jgi:pimeloyl-ACP methyl ester carboxylesterase
VIYNQRIKVIKVVILSVIFLAVVAAAVLIELYNKNDVEKKELTPAERKPIGGSFIKLSRGITHYQLAGPDTGRVIILVHGFSVPEYIWDTTYKYLYRHGFRVLRYDMYGRGFSGRPNVVYDKALYNQQLFDLIKQLHLPTPLNLAGVSFGGEVITNFTCQYPDLVNKVVLVDPGYDLLPPSKPLWLTDYYEAMHAGERAKGQLSDFKYPEKHPDWVNKYLLQMFYKGFRHAIISTQYNYNNRGRESNTCLNSKHKPVLLIWGKEDNTVPIRYSDSIRSVLMVDFFPVDDAGHLPFIEKAAIVNPKIAEFLKE